MPRLSSAALAIAIVLATGPTLQAQDTSSIASLRRMVAPDTATWPRLEQQPALIQPFFRFLVVAPGPMRNVSAEIERTFANRCDSGARAAAEAPSHLPSLDDSRLSWPASSDLLTMVVAPTVNDATPCEERWNQSAASAWTGVVLSKAGVPALSLDSVVLWRDGKAVVSRPVRTPLYVWTSAHWDSSRTRLSVSVPAASFAPRADGSLASIRLQALIGGQRVSITPSDSLLRLIAQALLVSRVLASDTLPSASRLTRPSVAAQRLVLDTDSRALAQLLATAPVGADQPGDEDVGAAGALRLASWAGREQDSVTTRFAVRSLLAEHPCFRSDSLYSDRSVQRELSAFRDAAACEPSSPLRVLLRGVVFPGGGAWTNHGSLVGVLASGLVLGPIVHALQLDRQSSATYAQYMQATDIAMAPRLFEQATMQRAQSRQARTLGVQLWIGEALIETGWRALRNHAIAEDHF